MNIIPAIDIQGGKCVRLYQGDFSKTTEYSSKPAVIAARFSELAVTDLHVVDLDGARSGARQNRETILAIAGDSRLSVQVGGGIRNRQSLDDWFDAGVARCVIGSLAIEEPDLVKSWIVRFGSERIVLALDVMLNDSDVASITTHGWTHPTNRPLYECIDDFRMVGVQRILCTDVSRDGAMRGPNIELYSSIMQRYPEMSLQASGGIRNFADLERLRAIGVPAAITGRALLDGKITAEEITAFQQSA